MLSSCNACDGVYDECEDSEECTRNFAEGWYQSLHWETGGIWWSGWWKRRCDGNDWRLRTCIWNLVKKKQLIACNGRCNDYLLLLPTTDNAIKTKMKSPPPPHGSKTFFSTPAASPSSNASEYCGTVTNAAPRIPTKNIGSNTPKKVSQKIFILGVFEGSLQLKSAALNDI